MSEKEIAIPQKSMTLLHYHGIFVEVFALLGATV